MGHYHLNRFARRLVTTFVLLTIAVTTFLPDWIMLRPAAAAPSAIDTASADPVADARGDVIRAETGAASPDASYELAPLDALVISEPGRADALAETITSAGGYVYVRAENAIFAGLNELSYSELAPVGASAVFSDVVPESALGGLPDSARSAARVWNEMAVDPPVQSRAAPAETGLSTTTLLPPASPDQGGAAAAYVPGADQTSVFMVGKVAVKVVFVESTAGPESWTETEVSKVKAEVNDALNWWTTTATAPDSLTGDPNPPANLEWTVSYVSPFDGTLADRANIQINYEPIQGGLVDAYNPSTATGWIPDVAASFTGQTGDTALRTWAHNTRQSANADWGMVLFVVDSSADPDGRLNDGKIGAGVINGPWAMVTYDGGEQLGVGNLEVLIAKMIGHVFGAGDESYDSVTDTGCHPFEVYGYLRVEHENCEFFGGGVDVSLMRSGNDMIDGYQNHALSVPARGQVGWRDIDENGVYDVVDTLSDTFDPDTYYSGGEAICPLLHLSQIPVDNDPALPFDFGPGGDENGWYAYVWDAGISDYVEAIPYVPTNINRVGYVWGRANNEEWIQASPSDGSFNSENESYTIQLPGKPGELNSIEIAIMDRWEQEVYRTPSPEGFYISDPPSAGLYEAEDTTKVETFQANDLTPGWSKSASDPGYSANYTMISGGTNTKACFGFTGTEVTLLHSELSTYGTGTVYVDGQIHSTIDYYSATPYKKRPFTITNLPPGDHTVELVANGVIDLDAFEITDVSTGNVLDAVADIVPTQLGFYENTEPLIFYFGEWTQTTIASPGRPGTPDGSAHQSTRAYDRVVLFFTNADTIGLYRGVFPGGGSADVYLDQQYWGTMQNDSATPRVVPFYISGLSHTEVHTVEIVVNPDAPRFDFDAFRLLNMRSDPTLLVQNTPGLQDLDFYAPQEVYGTWVDRTSRIESQTTGDLTTLFFQASAVSVRVDAGGRRGAMELYLDGKLWRTVDTDTKSASDVAFVVTGFDNPDGPHVLQLRVINVDPTRLRTLRVRGYRLQTVVPVGPGTVEEYDTYDDKRKPLTTTFLYEQRWKKPKYYSKDPGPYEDFYVETNHPDARVYLHFTGGDRVTIYATTGSYGSAEVYVDGTYIGLFNQSGKKGYGHPFTFGVPDYDPAKTYVLELRIHQEKGFKDRITLDRVLVSSRPVLIPGTYENDEIVNIDGNIGPAILFNGQWTRTTSDGVSGTIDILSDMKWKKDQVQPLGEVVFNVKNATSIVIYRRLYKKYGYADIYVDGEFYSSMYNYEKGQSLGIPLSPFVIGGLDPGFNHRIVIKPQPYGKKLDRTKGFDIDYVQVRDGTEPGTPFLTAGYTENNDVDALTGGAITYAGEWIPGAAHLSSKKGARATATFMGRAITVWMNRSDRGGRIEVYVDGEYINRYNTRLVPSQRSSYAFTGLDPDELHTVEVVVDGSNIAIDGFEVFDGAPLSSETYDLADGIPNPDGNLFLSGHWYVEGDFLRTSEEDASICIYATGAETLFTTIENMRGIGDIEFYVNGEYHSTADRKFSNGTDDPTRDFIVSGIKAMNGEGQWLCVVNPKKKRISLQTLLVGPLHPLLGSGDDVEAEGPSVFPTGYWRQYPKNPDFEDYSGGFYLESGNKYAVFYIPFQNASYVTVHRPVANKYGDVDVYLDGEYWGVMVNKASRFGGSVAYPIGPLPNDGQPHVLELRPTKKWRFALDRITLEATIPLSPGYYEDDSPVFAGGYDANLGQDFPSAYHGDWETVIDPLASGETYHYTKKRGDRVYATFYGNMLTIFRNLDRKGRYMTLYVDGNAYPINNRTSDTTPHYRVPHTILLPGNGPHTMELYLDSGRAYFDAVEIGNVVPAEYGAYQPDDPKVYVNDFNMWSTQISSLHSEGSYLYTEEKYASIFLLFHGTQVTSYMTTGRYWGMVGLYVDGVLHQEVDQYAYDKNTNPVDTPFYEVDIAGLTDDLHVLEVRFEGERGKKGKKRANFDAFTVDGAPVPRPGVVLPPTDEGGGGTGPSNPDEGCFEEAHPQWTLVPESGWNQRKNVAASGDYYYESPLVDGAYAEFGFLGPSASLVYHRGPAGGIVRVEVDGTLYTNGPFTGYLDMYYSTDLWVNNAVLNITGLDPDEDHVVQFIRTGDANPSATNSYMYIDRLDLPVFDPAYTDNCFYIPGLSDGEGEFVPEDALQESIHTGAFMGDDADVPEGVEE